MRYASREEMLTAYGPFAALFEPMDGLDTPYLTFLGPGAGAEAPIRLVQAAVATREGRDCVFVLLRDPNWRAQLVGAVAVYLHASRPAIEELWRAFDGGSWVSPQLAAVLSLRDGDFVDGAIVRVRQGCPVAIDPTYVYLHGAAQRVRPQWSFAPIGESRRCPPCVAGRRRPRSSGGSGTAGRQADPALDCRGRRPLSGHRSEVANESRGVLQHLNRPQRRPNNAQIDRSYADTRPGFGRGSVACRSAYMAC